MKKPFRSAPRGGYTLLEVLIALGLSTLLLGAVYSSLSMYWTYSTIGRDEIERAQLARAILRQIEIDLRSVVYKAATASSSASTTSGSSSSSGSGSSGSGSSSGSSTGSTSSGSTSGSSGSSGSSSGSSSSSTSGTATTTEPDAAVTSPSSGLFGNATTLLVHVSKPSRSEMYASMETGVPTTGRISDLQSVMYFVSGLGGGALSSAANSPGLARMAGDRLLMQMADQQGNTSTMAASTKILAPEVVSIGFVYFDGTNWVQSWDSSSVGGLPKAVEVVLELPIANKKAPRGITVNWGKGEAQVYRLIVPLPAGKPVIATTQ